MTIKTLLFILLQQAHETTSASEVIVMALISTMLILSLGMSGKVDMGFNVPGFPVPLRRNRKKILSKYFKFYNQLSEENKRLFEHKVQYFIKIKKFIPRQIPSITEEMKVLIAACAVRITFGYPKVFLSHFKRILVYPDDYYSTINKTYHKGEVNPKLKAIVLSWRSFVQGFMEEDGRNLGYHEMAHALHIEDMIMNNEYGFLDQEVLNEWEQLALAEMVKIETGNNHPLRAYACTNLHEFFSVSIEYFMEKPDDFKLQMPALYNSLVLLLRQDPTEL